MGIPFMSSVHSVVHPSIESSADEFKFHPRPFIGKQRVNEIVHYLDPRKDRQKSSHSNYQFPHISNSLHISDVIINIRSLLRLAFVYRQDRSQIKISDLRTSARPPKSYVFHEFPSFRAFLTHYARLHGVNALTTATSISRATPKSR